MQTLSNVLIVAVNTKISCLKNELRQFLHTITIATATAAFHHVSKSQTLGSNFRYQHEKSRSLIIKK